MEKYIYRAKLDRVVDGDTIDAMIDVGFDIFDIPLGHVRNYNRRVNRKLNKLADANFGEKIDPLTDRHNNNNDRMIGSAVYSIFERICKYLHCPDKEKFPIFKAIIEIVLAGGLPVGWKGIYSGPTLEPVTDRYVLQSGSFVVYWPYAQDPEFSDSVCCLNEN